MAMFKPYSNPFLTKSTKINHTLDFIISPFLFLWIRIYFAQIFFELGKKNFNHMDGNINLFKNNFIPSFLSSEILAYCTTFFELLCPVLLIMGIATRFASIPLILISLIIMCASQTNSEILIWIMLLSVLVSKGPSKFSLDYLLLKHYQRK